jgi:two-component system phosphate regulon sensor histidine kinase PhoR
MTVRIPLHIKLMGTYLLVVGLVLGPTVIYLRTKLERDELSRARSQLANELTGIAGRLEEATPAELMPRVALLLRALPTRLTVVDAEGNVLGDSYRPGAPLENHRDRPEIQEALRQGTGASLRQSSTTGQVMLYVARRFPARGPARGVVRLSRPKAEIHMATAQTIAVLRNASAVGLSAAVLLSLLAALAASRPLRRIAAGARAFASGDFAVALDVHTHDEIGEVAEALEALASQLRARLLTAGADRATLQALLDDLPVGVVLYDTELRAVTTNGAARKLCALPPHAELDRAEEIARLPDSVHAVTRVLRDGLTVEAPLVLPWRPEALLLGRWLAVFAPDGRRLAALVVIDQEDTHRIVALQRQVQRLAAQVRSLATRASDPEIVVSAMRDALIAEESLPAPPLVPEAITAVSACDLYALVAADVAPFMEAMGVRCVFEALDGDVRVVEGHERLRRSLRAMLRWAIERAGRRGEVAVSVTVHDPMVRFSLRTPRAAESTVPDAAWLLQPLGGAMGVEPSGDGVEGWITVPRA